MPTAVIADDEPLMRAALCEALTNMWPELTVMAQAEDGLAALRQIEMHRPDIAFLDIRMPGLTGLQVAQAITVPVKVVFVTAFDSHALEAFEANAVDYVLKPLDASRLAKTLAKLRRSIETAAAHRTSSEAQPWLEVLQQLMTPARAATIEWLQVAVGSHVRMVHVDDVMYFESDTKYTRVVAQDCDGLIRTPLKELLQGLDERLFLQTHRSMLVNRAYVRAVHRKDDVVELELKGRPERLKVSTANHHRFKAM